MKLSDYAAALALENGGFLMSGDASAALHEGDIIEITSRAGLSVTGVKVMPLVDAPRLPWQNLLIGLLALVALWLARRLASVVAPGSRLRRRSATRRRLC